MALAVTLGMPAECAGEKRPWQKRWWVTAALVAAASVADLHSTRGLAESNPLLRNGQGGISIGRGTLLKTGTCGGLLLVEALLLKKYTDMRMEKPFAVTNAIAAGVLSAAAVRNYSIPRTAPNDLAR